MKQYFLKLGMAIAMLLSFLPASAYDFEVDGIYYNVNQLNDTTCTVTYNPDFKGTEKLNYVVTSVSGITKTRTFSDYYPSYSGSVTIPKKVTYKNRELTVTGISWNAFFGCKNLYRLSLPSTIEDIYSAWSSSPYFTTGTFEHCNISEFTTGNGYILQKLLEISPDVTPTDAGAYAKDHLESLILSEDFAGEINVSFQDCSKLQSIICHGNEPPKFTELNPFTTSQYIKLSVWVPDDALETYKSCDVWKNFWELKILKAVKSITLNESYIDLEPNWTFQLIATLDPDDPDDRSLTWTSSNPNVAIVDNDGLVTAIAKGDAIISVTSNDWHGAKTECAVHVDRLVKDLKLSENDLSLEPEQTHQLSITITPSDALVQDVTWCSLNSDVATVDENGLVTAHSIGTTNISVSSTDGSDITVYCKITVAELVKSININPDKVSVNEGESTQLEAIVAPDTATEKTVVWSSENNDIATVDESGLVTGIMPGTVKIHATAIDGSEVTGTCSILVVPLVKDIQLSKTETIIEPGLTEQLIATVLPNEAYIKDVVWASENEDIATVNENGLVTAHSIGTTNISVSSTDGSDITVYCKVTVAELVKTITINPDKTSVKEGESTQLEAIVAPDTATEKTVVWSSENNDIATVDESGLVTGIMPGTVKIHATATDGSGISGECQVTVTAETFALGNLCYQRNSASTLKVVSNSENPYSGDIIIPNFAEYKGKDMPVIEIGEGAFADCNNLTRVVIPSTVENIAEDAFAGCSGLVYAKISDGSILSANLDALFKDSPIEELYIGSDKLTYDSDSRLSGRVTTMTLGSHVTTFPPKKAFDTLRCFIIEPGENPMIEPEDFCSGSMSQTGQQTLKDPNTYIYYRIIYTIKYSHLYPLIDAVNNGTLDYLHIDRETEYVEVDKSKTRETRPTSAGSRYQEFGYMDEILYNYQEVTVISDHNKKPIESISFGSPVMEMNVGESVKLMPLFGPVDASFTSVNWVSSNEDAAVVDVFGNVTKLNDDEAVITATTTDGTDLSASVRVVRPGTGINNVLPTDGTYIVCNPQGMVIMKAENADMLKQLQKGVYIINGKKVIVE